MEHGPDGPDGLQYTPRTLAALGRKPNTQQNFEHCVQLGLRKMKLSKHQPSIQFIIATRDFGRLKAHIADNTDTEVLAGWLNLVLASKSLDTSYSPYSPFALMLFAITDAFRGSAPPNTPWADIMKIVVDAELWLASDRTFAAWFAEQPTPFFSSEPPPPTTEHELFAACSESELLPQVARELRSAFPNSHVPRDKLFEAARDRARSLIAAFVAASPPTAPPHTDLLKNRAWVRAFLIRAIKADSYFAVWALISFDKKDGGRAFDALIPPAQWWLPHKERLATLLYENGFGMSEVVRARIEYGNPLFAAKIGINVSEHGALPDFHAIKWDVNQLAAYYGLGGVNVKLAPIPPAVPSLKEFLLTYRQHSPTLVIQSSEGNTVVGFDPDLGRVVTSGELNVTMLLTMDEATSEIWPYTPIPRSQLDESNPVGLWVVQANPTALHVERAFWITVHFFVSGKVGRVNFY